jgi:hypothetical protein
MSSNYQANGLHNPEHVMGGVEVGVGYAYMSEEEGRTVEIKTRYPNGTVSTVRLAPATAREVAADLVEHADALDEK